MSKLDSPYDKKYSVYDGNDYIKFLGEYLFTFENAFTILESSKEDILNTLHNTHPEKRKIREYLRFKYESLKIVRVETFNGSI